MKTRPTVLRTVMTTVACLLSLVVATPAADNIVFPAGVGVLDVTKPPYNIDNTGRTDVADTLSKLLQSNAVWKIIYLPNGTYRVSKTVAFLDCNMIGCTGPNGVHGPVLVGQSRRGTVIRLDAGSFTNAASPQPVVRSGDGVAENFDRGLHNLTVIVGPNNPGAWGVYWYSNNGGSMSEVDIIAEDATPLMGLNLGNSINGPTGVFNTRIQGFKTGVYCYAVNSVTIRQMSLSGQTEYGIVNEIHGMFIDSLISTSAATAVWNKNGGKMSLINARLSGGGSTVPAVKNEGLIFARDIVTSGYQRALTSTNGTAPTGATATEFSSFPAKTYPGSPTHSMRLTMKQPVLPAWETDTSKWANIVSYKGRLGQPQKTDAQAMQAAIDDPTKTAVVLPNGRIFTLNTPVYVRGNISRIIGTAGSLSGDLIVIDAAGAPSSVEIRWMQGLRIIQQSSRTLHIRSMHGAGENSGATAADNAGIVVTGTGDVFLEDVVSKVYMNNAQGHLWAWHWDIEDSDNLIVDAGRVWMCGWKDEGCGRAGVLNGGFTELIGMWQYANCTPPQDPMFVVNNGANFCLAGLGELMFSGTHYETIVQQTKGGVMVNTLARDNPAGYNMPLYCGYDSTLVGETAVERAASSTLTDHAQALTVKAMRGTQGSVTFVSSAPHAEIALLDARGRVVALQRGGSILSASGLSRGTYLLQAHAGSQTLATRLVIDR